MLSLRLRFLRRKLAGVGLPPRSRVGRLAMLFLLLDLFIYATQRGLLAVGRAAAASAMDGWLALLTLTSAVLSAILLVRWIRHDLLWRLRNRLIVTYIFIGVIPVALIVIMGSIAMYLFAGQFATALTASAMHQELLTLKSANAAMAVDLAYYLKMGGSFEEAKLRRLESIEHVQAMPEARVIGNYRGRTAVLQGDPPATASERSLPPWIDRDFAGAVEQDRKVALRALSRAPVPGGGVLYVWSNLPLSGEALAEIAAPLGEVVIFSTYGRPQEKAGPAQELEEGRVRSMGGRRIRGLDPGKFLHAGSRPPAQGPWDLEINFGTLIPVVDWQTGKTATWTAEGGPPIIAVHTRLSALYQQLFAHMGSESSGMLIVVGVIAVVFGVIELFAFFIGVGLTRTITKSISELYLATQRVNRGDFRHRIAVKSHDQLAALELSFNNMSASLEQLILEQKEKQRMDSELAIAQEVQGQLFPRQEVQLASLELHGVCRPARTVSGDYYDFIPLGGERMSIALGDISGKGISAALLMATVHSAVRVFELGAVLEAAGTTAGNGGNPLSRLTRSASGKAGIQSPSDVLWLLNRHLYRSTPAEKYATMFLGVFDGATRRLTYSNGGHLPPLLIDGKGGVRKLDAGGTVVGLFEDMSWEEREVELRPGDVFVAYSDGITEPENEFGEFGETRLLELILENLRLPLAQISEQVVSAVRDWNGAAEQPDDVTLVLARGL
jgi:phosphoserine phosphatase RsbU/P